ncbi:MAG: zinc ribbon domain-containing protein [Candidatus Margulisbacteria bacterium]|nr:zinc ribbon domain-containing protein [Candidatus Margulisiibacteriota bacterium]
MADSFEKDKKRKILYPNADQLKVINQVLIKLNELDNIKQTVDWVNRNKLMGDKKLCHTSLKRMILTEDQADGGLGGLLEGVYARNMYEVVNKRKSKKDKKQWERISIPSPIRLGLIDEKQLVSARELLLEKKKNYKRHTKPCVYLLSGLLFCSKCGMKMYGHTQVKGISKYRCKACGFRVNKKDFDEHVMMALNSMVLETEEVQQQLNSSVCEGETTSKRQLLDKAIRDCSQDLVEIEKRRKGMFRAYGDELITKDAFDLENNKCNDEQAKIKDDIRKAEDELNNMANYKADKGVVLEKAMTIKQLLSQIDDEKLKNQLLKIIVKKIDISDTSIAVEIYPWEFLKYAEVDRQKHGKDGDAVSLRQLYGPDQELHLPAAPGPKLLEQTFRPIA